MGLITFLRINLPYGLERHADGSWTAFNREYCPLGWNDNHRQAEGPPQGCFIFTKYHNLTDELLLEVAETDGDSIQRDSEGRIVKIWLYSDLTHPTNSELHWKRYSERLFRLGSLVELSYHRRMAE
jgi:hypothetical protein